LREQGIGRQQPAFCSERRDDDDDDGGGCREENEWVCERERVREREREKAVVLPFLRFN